MIDYEFFQQWYMSGSIQQFRGNINKDNPLYQALNSSMTDDYMYYVLGTTNSEVEEYRRKMKEFGKRCKFVTKAQMDMINSDPEIRSWFNYCFDFVKDHLEYIYEHFVEATSSPYIYRALFVRDKSQINTELLGHSWTYSEEMAETWRYNKTGCTHKYIVKAVNDESNINWRSTVFHYAIWSHPMDDSGEREIKLKSNVKPEIIGIRDYGHI